MAIYTIDRSGIYRDDTKLDSKDIKALLEHCDNAAFALFYDGSDERFESRGYKHTDADAIAYMREWNLDPSLVYQTILLGELEKIDDKWWLEYTGVAAAKEEEKYYDLKHSEYEKE